jgi:hypothetical protein
MIIKQKISIILENLKYSTRDTELVYNSHDRTEGI